MGAGVRGVGVGNCRGLSGGGVSENQRAAPAVERPPLEPLPNSGIKPANAAKLGAPLPQAVPSRLGTAGKDLQSPVRVLESRVGGVLGGTSGGFGEQVRFRQTEGKNPKANITVAVLNNRGQINGKPSKGQVLELGAGSESVRPLGRDRKLTLSDQASVQLSYGSGAGARGRGVLNSDSYSAGVKGSAQIDVDPKGSNLGYFLGVDVEGNVSGNYVSPSNTQLRVAARAGAKLAVDLDPSRAGPELNVRLGGGVQDRVTLSGRAPAQVVPTLALNGTYEADKNTTLFLDAGYTFPTRNPASSSQFSNAAVNPGVSVSGGARVKF